MSEQENPEQPSRVESVIKNLKSISHEVVGPKLDARLREAQAVDPSAGIVLVGLPEAGETIIGSGLKYHYHGARVLTGDQNFVKPHYHEKGEEPYHILTGNGEMNLGIVKDGQVDWRPAVSVKEGEIVEVQENEVHSLRNPGEKPLDFTFACPDEHLVDNSPEHPEGDRYFTMDLPNGFPPHYPKL
jgi:mannose-6-phosphate isomerase-like protein (cupin superfamily)